MAKDPTNFRKRFKLYKEGKMPYENGLPKYEDGKDPIDQSRIDARELIELAVLLSQNSTFGKRNLSPESYYLRYRNSEGFRKRFDTGYGEEGAFYRLGIDLKKVPAIKYGDNEGSMYIPNQNLVYMGSNTNDDYAKLGLHNRDFVKAHEQAHSVYNDNIFGKNDSGMLGRPVELYMKLDTPNLSNYRSWVDKNNNYKVDFSHDSRGIEGGADVGALGWLLYNEGVFNRMDPSSKVTKELLDKFYEDYKTKNPNNPYLRPLENYGTEKAAWLLNNTASVLKKPTNGLLHAKNGKLPGYAYGTASIIDLLDQDQLDTLHYIHNYFSDRGMGLADISGIMANIFKESSFRDSAKDSAGYHGYVQMSPDMQAAVMNAYGNLDPDTQLLFILDLITGNSRVKGYTNGFGYKYGLYKTGGDAAEAFRSTFERNKAGRQQSRIDYGNLFYDYLSNLTAQTALQKQVGEQPMPIVEKPDAVAVRKTIPKSKTRARWTGAENVSPYLTNKPILKLKKEIKPPDIVELHKESLWKAPMLFKDGKLPRYGGGKIPYVASDGTQYNIDPNVVGSDLINITTPEVVVTGTDRRPMYQRYDAENSTYDPDAVRMFTDWAPVVSDIGDGLDAYNAFKNKDWSLFGIIAGAALLPNIVEKALQPVLRFVLPIAKRYISPLVDKYISPTIDRLFSNTKQLSLPSSETSLRITADDFNFDFSPNLEDSRVTTVRNATEQSILDAFDSRLPYAKNTNGPLVRAVPATMENNKKLVDHYLLLIKEQYPGVSDEEAKKLFEQIHEASVDDVLYARGMTVRDPVTHEVKFVSYNNQGNKTRAAATKTHEENHTLYDLDPDRFLHDTVTALDSPLGVKKNYLNEEAGYSLPKNISDPNNYDGVEEYLSADEVSSFMSEVKSLLGKTEGEGLTEGDIKWFIENHNIIGDKLLLRSVYKSIAEHITNAKKFANWCNDYSNVVAALAIGGAATAAAAIPEYANGKLPGYADGKIHIKPSKRGTFTAAAKKHGASVREFESRVLKNPEKYSTAMVKKARFSRNARSWKH